MVLQFVQTPRIDILVQDLLKSNWPTVANVDLAKLQTTVDKIDWGHNYNEHTNFRASIKMVDVSMGVSDSIKTWSKRMYAGTADVRVQYRSVGEEQPQEIWNIGHEIKNIIARNPRALTSSGINDIELSDYSLEEEAQGIVELQEYHQELKIKQMMTLIDM